MPDFCDNYFFIIKSKLKKKGSESKCEKDEQHNYGNFLNSKNNRRGGGRGQGIKFKITRGKAQKFYHPFNSIDQGCGDVPYPNPVCGPDF